MKNFFFSIMLVVLFTAGCTLKVIPQPVPQGVIDPADNSQTISKGGISVRVANADPQIISYNLEGTVSAFSVAIQNKTDREISFDNSSFLLLDDQGRQYQQLTPEKVKEYITKDSYYLLPYPYVGFYYLEDYEKVSSYTATDSQLPYYFEVYPQDIFTKALDARSIIPGATAVGLVYFRVDLPGIKEVKFLVYEKGTSKSAAADFAFPFIIKK
ncbi:lipoprotein [Geotalea uraniireducens]|uniref:Lipoprotein n=1 Tax=Geotalea uraniireducens TaxID=351604 RepID=A0ABM8ELP4_9BACT|nr:hypothetical protein [Geotalea uraniireducens]BDV43242.1 lipoprotein [Geotalea uraniireducens]